MEISIRKFLLINLLLAMTIIISLTAIGNYYLDKQDIENYLDDFLGQTGLSFTAIALHDIQGQNWSVLQARMDTSAQHIKSFRVHHDDTAILRDEAKYHFQIWGPDDKLLLRSTNAPLAMLSGGKIGFTDYFDDDKHYRVFSNYDPETHLTFIVAEPYTRRDSLVHHIMADDLYIMLLTYPLAGILIWVIIGRGLSSLRIITAALRYRDPQYLESVSLEGVPIEIQPLIVELNKLLQRLQEAFEREKRFAADAAHELRTPLAAIRAQAQVALIWSANPEQLVVLQNVIQGVDRAAHVVNQLLAMSRVSSENEQLTEITACNIRTIVQEVVSQLSLMADEKHIQLVTDISPDFLVVSGNIPSLHILVRNLIDNAIRYTPTKGKVVVKLFQNAAKQVVLAVSDNGPGVPEKYRERIFERFFRILGTESPGSGLGLSLVRQIADLHQATLALAATNSVTQKGLTVTVTFPALKLSAG